MTSIAHAFMPNLAEERQLLLVSPSQLPLAWPHAVPLLEEGKEYWQDFATLDSLYQDLSASKLQLWMMNCDTEFILAMLTEIGIYPTTKIMRILWIGGSEVNGAIDQFLDFAELWAHRQGVSRLQVIGRKGWVRKLKGRGYKQTQWIVSKDITGIKEH